MRTARIQPTRVAQLLRLLPAALLKPLDAWSHRRALRRARQRQQRWLQRQAALSALVPAALQHNARVRCD